MNIIIFHPKDKIEEILVLVIKITSVVIVLEILWNIIFH